ncbi:hypothetical protein ABPG74_003720 [Tetrahymena malaccensis]
MNAAGVRENMNPLVPSQNKLNRNEEALQSELNSLQQQMMPSAKRSFSAEGTVKRGSKLRTTMRNEFFNGAKNANPEEDSSQKKTTLVVLKRYNSAFPKDFFGNVRQGNEQVQNKFPQNDSSAAIMPTGYTYSIRQDSYQFLQQQQQQFGFLNENQSQQNSKLTRQQIQNLNQSQYLHQNMYSLQQGVKQMMPAPGQIQQQNLSNMQNSLQMINQPFPSSQILQQQQQHKYRCQSEADSPIKKSAYDILENSSRIPQITQSEQKIQYANQIGPSATHQMYIQQQQPQQIQYLKNNPINSTQHQNYNQSYLNSNNYPSSSLVSGENSPLKEQKFNNQTSFSAASSQWKHIFTNNQSSSQQSQQQQQQQQIPKMQQFQAVNSIIKNQLKTRQNIPPKPQFQHQNYATYCKTEQNEDSLQSNSNSITDNPRSINQNNLDIFRNTANNDTPKFTSDDSTTLSSQQNQTNSFTAAIIQQQLMQRIQNNNPNQIQNKSQFSANQTQNDQLKLKIAQLNSNAPSYHLQTKQKRKSQATRSQSEIKLSNSLQCNQNQQQNCNNSDQKNLFQEELVQKSEKEDANLDQSEDKKNNLNYATFSSSALLKINYLHNEKKKQIEQSEMNSHQQQASILQQSLQNNNTNSLLNSLQLQQNINLQQKQQTNALNSSSGSGEDKLNFNQSRQFFDFKYQMQNESQIGLVQSINGTQNEINILDNKQLLNKDYSCFQFNLQPIPGLQNQAALGQNSYQSYHLNSRNISPEDDRNGKENLINQINNIFQNKANKVDLQHSQKSNYLNILHSQQINGLTKKISSNSSENVNEQNQSSSENKNSNSSLQKLKKQNEEFKEQKYTNEFIDNHIRNSEKLVSRASQIEEQESPTEKVQNLSRKNSNSQIPKPAKSASINSSSKKKSRIKVIYPAQMDPNTLSQSSNLRTQSEANLSTRQKKNSIIKPFQCQNNYGENKVDNSNDISEDNFSPVHFHRLNTEADKDSENIQSNYDFSRKVFSVSSFQQLDSNNPDSAQQKKRVRKPKSYHSQQVFNLNSSDTKKKIGFFNQNQEQSASNNFTQIIENTQISNYPNGNMKEKQQQDQQPLAQNSSTTTLPKIYTHQNTLSQSKQNFTKQRIRFNSYQKSKTEISPKDEDNQNNLSYSSQFQKQSVQKKNNLSQQQQQQSSQQNQKNNQTMKLSDFVSLSEKKQSAGSTDYEQKKTSSNEGASNQKEPQIKANPFLQSNLNPNQFEFSFRNNQCQKESEKQISQQINKHKIQTDSHQSSRNSIIQPNNNSLNQTNNNPSNLNQIYEQKSQQHAPHNQHTNQLYNFKLNINHQQPYQSKDSIKLSSTQLKQPNKFLSEKKQIISQNLKTDYS